jgi:succinyl-CoA synthetase beta subunit
MKIHEYQAKQILAHYGIPVPPGQVADRVEEVEAIAERLGPPVVVKGQVHVGGRGQAGAIKVARSVAEAGAAGAQILGLEVRSKQAGARPPRVKEVLVEKALEIAAEYYLGITVDRAQRCNALIFSAAGGMEIEEVAWKSPEKVVRLNLHPTFGLLDFQVRQALFQAGLPPAARQEASRVLRALYRAFVEVDAVLMEINPLILTPQGEMIAADAKIDIDDNALFRHPDLVALRREQEDGEIEAEAHRRGLQYVLLEGNIGIIGNGAGLVMSTVDEVARVGAAYGMGPANFLDIGGGARSEVVRQALEVVLLNPRVEGILINIFGGITRCDEVARGILEAIRHLNLQLPLVVRLAGTNEEEGRRLLAEESNLVAFTSMQEAAAAVIREVMGRG